MCSGCFSLTGFPLDVYAAALERARDERLAFVAAVERGGHPGLTEMLAPLLADGIPSAPSDDQPDNA
jgi:hypothetical protein